MNQTLQLTDYIPQYVSLYYVDYRDDLDEHEDIQEECIRSNNMEKLYNKRLQWKAGGKFLRNELLCSKKTNTSS
jgi:hypothetical protein